MQPSYQQEFPTSNPETRVLPQQHAALGEKHVAKKPQSPLGMERAAFLLADRPASLTWSSGTASLYTWITPDLLT